jgi:predicted nucleotidyltransferase
MPGLEDRQKEYVALLGVELERLTAELRAAGADLIVLFGSYAKGKVDLLTDLDILAVLPGNLPFVERTAELYRKLAPRVAADILAYTSEEWLKMTRKPFIQNALAKGRVLHAKGSFGRS